MPKARGHRKQHFVPQSYLKAWCDPATPPGQEPYVWRFNKDGSDPRRKAPENIFAETDLYTIRGANGERDLVLEHGLSELEGDFVTIRDTKLACHEPLTQHDRMMLCAFLAAAHVRTPARRDHLGSQWGKVLEKTEQIREWAKSATPEQKRAVKPIARGDGPTLGYEDVKRLAEWPMQEMLAPMVEAQVPFLMGMDIAIMECDSGSAFITSDNPCVWQDPAGYRRPPMFQGPALMYPTIEISMPVSPRQRILLNRQGVSGHIQIPERLVDQANRLTRLHCSEHFICNSNVTPKPAWFDRGVEPEDSWRKQHEIKCPRCQSNAQRTAIDMEEGHIMRTMVCENCRHTFKVRHSSESKPNSQG